MQCRSFSCQDLRVPCLLPETFSQSCCCLSSSFRSLRIRNYIPFSLGTAASLFRNCCFSAALLCSALRIRGRHIADIARAFVQFADSRFVMSIVWMRQKSRVHRRSPKWRLCSMCRGFLNSCCASIDVGIATDVHALLLKLPPESMLIALRKLCCTWKITAPPA